MTYEFVYELETIIEEEFVTYISIDEEEVKSIGTTMKKIGKHFKANVCPVNVLPNKEDKGILRTVKVDLNFCIDFYSGSSRKLRVYVSEYSKLIQVMLDPKVIQNFDDYRTFKIENKKYIEI